MSFTCEKCGKICDREIDLKRHMGRKIPCDRQLVCNKCSKEFTKMSHYKQHMNKKNPCVDKETLRLMLQIEEEKLKQEIEKTKHAKIASVTNITNIGRDQNNNQTKKN